MNCKKCNKEINSVRVVVNDISDKKQNTSNEDMKIIEINDENYDKTFEYGYNCPHCNAPLDREQIEEYDNMNI